jgi:hypothetical protein
MTNTIVLRGSGMDCVANLIHDGFIRPIDVNGEQYGSLVDVMEVFSGTKNPRQYWKDHKKQILTDDPELVENVYQLKLPAADGKNYKTDVAPLWVCVFVALTINHDFRKRLAKFTASEIKYRMGNVARGSEWAADSIHRQMVDSGCTMNFTKDDDKGWGK